MPQKPDYIVDPPGNVRDVRGQIYAHESQSSSQQPETRSSTPGNYGYTANPQRKPGGIIIIPIGLIITLIITILRNCGGPAQNNTYPESDVNMLNMGLYYYDQGDYEKAIMQFNMAIASQPEMGEAYNDRGLAYYAMGETGKAITDFNKAIELLPNPAISYSNRGGVYLFMGNYEQALTDLDKAIELSPSLAKAYHNRGLTYLDLGNYDQAIADFDQAIELTPEFIFAAQATMESRMPTGENLLGSGFLTGMMDGQTYADLPTAYASRAIAYLQKGDYERATADLEKATLLGLDPSFAQQIGALRPVLTLTPQPGHWMGTSYHGGYQGAVSFDIGADGQIHNFKLNLLFGAENSCQAASDAVWVQPDGTFAFNFGSPGIEGGNLIQGEFESSTAVAGSFSRHIECISTTGDQINGELSQGASWNAQWIDSLEETPAENIPSNQLGSTATSNESESAYITALAIDPVAPSTLYAGTIDGIFKSTDAGENWRAVTAGLPISIVNILVIDPLTTETLYAGTSDGLFKSTDGAESWSEIDSVTMYPYVSTIVLDPERPKNIYVGTLIGVYKSTDGGTNWIGVDSGMALSFVYALAVDPTTPAIIYAGTSDGAFKSMDGGASWYEVNNGLPYSNVQILAIDPAMPTTLYAGTGEGLFKSTDGGANWSNIFWYLPIVTFAIDPKTPSTIYLGRSDGMYTSTDGGVNWSVVYGIQTDIFVTVLAVDPLIPGAFYAGTSNGIFRITNGGRDWISISNGLTK